jgi:hypothetical protein
VPRVFGSRFRANHIDATLWLRVSYALCGATHGGQAQLLLLALRPAAEQGLYTRRDPLLWLVSDHATAFDRRSPAIASRCRSGQLKARLFVPGYQIFKELAGALVS